MTTGILIFAFNNESYDYLSMAAWSANNIHRLLNLPVAVVTNATNIPAHYKFDQVIVADPIGTNRRYFNDLGQSASWHNSNRIDAFAVSPWDTTIVLDADYVVASNQLLKLLDTKQDFLSHRWAYDVVGQKTFEGLNYFGQHNMPMWWATVMMFQKNKTSELIFDCMRMVRENWQHYRNLYKNARAEYRSDHALSIALNIVNGHTSDYQGIHWDLATMTVDCKLSQLAEDSYKIEFTTPQKQPRWIKVQGHDFHVLDKTQLGALIGQA